MSFINEYVSEDDIQKYQLDNLINTILELPEDCMRMPERRLKGYQDIYWTVDKTINSWLMYMKTIYSYEGSCSGRPEPTGERVFCFFWNGQVYQINIFLSEKSSVTNKDNPYIQAWEKPLSIIPELGAKDEQSLITDLKEALTVYGEGGIKWQVANTVVTFDF